MLCLVWIRVRVGLELAMVRVGLGVEFVLGTIYSLSCIAI